MENQEIKIEDVQVGDELLIGSSSGLKYIRILRPLKLARKPNWRGDAVYSKVKCSWREDVEQYTIPGRNYTYNFFYCSLTPENHNKETYVDLNYKKLWLIKKGREI